MLKLEEDCSEEEKSERRGEKFIDREMKLQNLDSLLLFLTSILGFFFSFIYVFFGYVEVALGFTPVIVLGLVIPIYVGYVRGGIIVDTLEERVRGWIYFVAGVTVYLIQNVVWLVGKMLPTLLSPYGSLLYGVVYIVSMLFIGLVIARGRASNWISTSIFRAFDGEVTKLTQKMFDDTNDSAGSLAILFFVSFSLYMTRVQFIELSVFFYLALAFCMLYLYEKDIRKLIKVNKYLSFLNVEGQWTKPRIPRVFSDIGIISLILGLFLMVGVAPILLQTFLPTFYLITMILVLLGVILLGLSRRRYGLRFSRKEIEIPEDVEKALKELLRKDT